MKCESLKDLKNIIALCRKTGIKSIEVDGVRLELGEAPAKAKAQSERLPQEDEVIESDTPSAEEMLYWSTPNDPTVSDPDEKVN